MKAGPYRLVWWRLRPLQHWHWGLVRVDGALGLLYVWALWLGPLEIRRDRAYRDGAALQAAIDDYNARP